MFIWLKKIFTSVSNFLRVWTDMRVHVMNLSNICISTTLLPQETLKFNSKLSKMHLTRKSSIDHLYNSTLVNWSAWMGQKKRRKKGLGGWMRFIHAKGSWHSCEVGRGQGRSLHLCCWSLEGFLDGALFSWFDLVLLPSNGSITHLNSHGHCHILHSPWFLCHQMEIFKCNPSLMAGQHRFQSNGTDIFTFYILNTGEIDTACRSPQGFEVIEHPGSSHQPKLLPWHQGMNTDKRIKRWSDLMHGRDTATWAGSKALK